MYKWAQRSGLLIIVPFFLQKLAMAAALKFFIMATDDECQNTDARRETTSLTTSISHPRLASVDAEFIQVFLQLFDSYATAINERARQLLGEEHSSTKFISPKSLKFWVSWKQLEVVNDLNLSRVLLLTRIWRTKSLGIIWNQKPRKKNPT